MSNLALNLVGTARRIPNRMAAIAEDTAMTYAELDAAASRFAAFLDSEGIGVGDRVGVMLPNIPAAPIAHYGIWRLGGVAVPMNPLMQAGEVPKGAELTHGSLGSNQDVVVRRLLNLTDDDVVLACLPLFHVFGMTRAMNAAVAAGAGLSLMARFQPVTAIERIRRDRVTVLEAVPTMYSALLSVADQFSPEATASLRTCVSGGAALPVAVLNDFEKTFDAVILEGYGLSETSPAATFNHPDAERRPGSIGTPIEGVQVRLVDESGNEVPTGSPGEMQVKGPNVMKGYWNLPEATDASIKDGWFSTGDIAVVDEDGYYWIVDRKKDLISRGGYNVYPREIEEELHEYPAVAQVAVIGIAHDSLGEEVGAAVVLKAGETAVVEELRQFVKARVAAYKYPRRIWFVEGLPTGPTGKLLRREVIPPPTEEA
jgi:long-chain acyl-CoA synthetase